jgi:DNA mismatch endonuclease, patch repair protein
VDGCFWHGCPRHGRNTPFNGPNADLWHAKMLRNRERDERSSALAESLGWRVERVWECEVREAPAQTARRLLQISENDLSQQE